LSLVILRKRLQVHNWLGISLVVVGLFFVGFAGFLKNADGNNNNTNKVDTSLFFFWNRPGINCSSYSSITDDY